MANEHHVQILKKGVKVWNEWRNELSNQYHQYLEELSSLQEDFQETGVTVDFSEIEEANKNLILSDKYEEDIDLSNTNLGGYNLDQADFINTNLSGTDLSEASLRGADLSHANLAGTDLRDANLYKAKLIEADLTRANLLGADLEKANLRGANLTGADLSNSLLSHTDLQKATFYGASLDGAEIIGANLCGANLTGAILVRTDLSGSDISDAFIYGISAWDLYLGGTTQKNLIISAPGDPIITVDNLEVAQFIYLLINNEKIRDVIDTITSKAVLILGRFKPERKVVLNSIRDEIRQQGYLPILFDFEKSTYRNTIETISTLAHMARFVIADLTDAKSVLQELQHIVPGLPSVPIQPLLLTSDYEPGMLDHFKNFPWFLKIYKYNSTEDLLCSFRKKVIEPSEARVRKIQKFKHT